MGFGNGGNYGADRVELKQQLSGIFVMDLITLAAAQAIAKIALDKFIESGAGELGKTRQHEEP